MLPYVSNHIVNVDIFVTQSRPNINANPRTYFVIYYR
jgi:hypothetical protein